MYRFKGFGGLGVDAWSSFADSVIGHRSTFNVQQSRRENGNGIMWRDGFLAWTCIWPFSTFSVLAMGEAMRVS